MIYRPNYSGAANILPPELTKLQRDAELVRAHLVSVRGGAIFLSPADAERLHLWLLDGVTPSEIMLAIERAAQRRAQTVSKLPLTLGRAGRHLGKRASSFSLTKKMTSHHPLGAIIDALRHEAQRSKNPQPLRALSQRLAALETLNAELATQATALTSQFFLSIFDEYSEVQRADLEEEAHDSLGDLGALLSATQMHNAIEERSRAILRDRFPYLSAATIFEQVE